MNYGNANIVSVRCNLFYFDMNRLGMQFCPIKHAMN